MSNNPPETSFQYYVCTDPEEQQLIDGKLVMIKRSRPLRYDANNLTSENIQHAKALFEDINSNKQFWMDKVLRIHALYGIWCPTSQTVSGILYHWAQFLMHTEKPRQATRALDLAVENVEIAKAIIFATPLSPVFESARNRFDLRTFNIHLVRQIAAVRSNARQQALESFRVCADLEVRGDLDHPFTCIKTDKFVSLLTAAGQEQLFLRAFEELSATLLVGVLDGIGDDNLWDHLQGISFFLLSLSKCSLCFNDAVTMQCSCGKAAYCSLEHRMMHWRAHRSTDCCCAHCGNNNLDLQMCLACKQTVLCCQEHNVAHWPEHREECKELRKKIRQPGDQP